MFLRWDDYIVLLAMSNYASNLLYIRTLGLVKVSICFHIYSLTPVRTHRMVRVAAGAFCALWALLSLVVAAFEYSPPDVWRNLGSNVVAAAIVQLHYLQAKISGSTDIICDLWVAVLYTQIVIAFGIITACYPFLKSLMDALETGLVRVDTRPPNGDHITGSSTGKQYSASGGGYYRAQGSQFKQHLSSGGTSTAVQRDVDSSLVNHWDVAAHG
ncbi:MAG: hypothetical protein L6R39_002249 [Caloplaca ligustica]|nr:MAG: hypothetical protein L6R39_002249 [Caloplaca ligustica]